MTSPEMSEICRQKAQKLDLHPTLYQQNYAILSRAAPWSCLS
jgi:hypothetical protein